MQISISVYLLCNYCVLVLHKLELALPVRKDSFFLRESDPFSCVVCLIWTWMAWLQFVEKSLAFLERAFSREFDSSRMLRPDPIPRSVPPIETRLARGEVRFLERKTALRGALPWRLELPCKRVQELSWVNVLV